MSASLFSFITPRRAGDSHRLVSRSLVAMSVFPLVMAGGVRLRTVRP